MRHEQDQLAATEASLAQSHVESGDHVRSRILPTDASIGPRQRRVGAKIFFFCFLGVQLFLPLRGIGKSPPARLSWQMYATRGSYQDLFIRRIDGTADTVASVKYMISARQEIEWWPAVATHLCEVYPKAFVILPSKPDREIRAHACP